MFSSPSPHIVRNPTQRRHQRNPRTVAPVHQEGGERPPHPSFPDSRVVAHYARKDKWIGRTSDSFVTAVEAFPSFVILCDGLASKAKYRRAGKENYREPNWWGYDEGGELISPIVVYIMYLGGTASKCGRGKGTNCKQIDPSPPKVCRFYRCELQMRQVNNCQIWLDLHISWI